MNANGFNPNEELQKAYIDPDAIIDEPPTILEINGQSVFTLGNFSVISGKAKSRKTFFASLILAANAGCDIEGLTTTEDTKAVFMDTEQAKHDVQKVLKRVEKMGGNPDKTEFYCLRKYTPEERKQIIREYINQNPEVKFVFIDGVRDLAFDINSPKEATELIGWVMKITGEKNLHMSLILHQNKSKDDTNLRGHLGTEATNKAETVISVTQTGEASTAKAEYTRSKSFSPISFNVNDEGLPYITNTSNSRALRVDANTSEAEESLYFEVGNSAILEDVFTENERYTYNDLVNAIQSKSEEKGNKIGINKVKSLISTFKEKGYLENHGERKTKSSYYTYVSSTSDAGTDVKDNPN